MLISSGGPLAQHCCVSKPLGLAGLPTLGERPTDKRAGARRQPTTLAARLTSTLACTGGTGSERGGVLWRRDCGTMTHILTAHEHRPSGPTDEG
jgi:hypothetical protein